jgi:TrmH family RNA methyltransferase
MLTKNQLKYYTSLHLKKIRKEENKFFVEGRRIVEEGLQSDFECEVIFLSNSFKISNPGFLKQLINSKQRFELLKDEDFEKICMTKNPQGIAAVFYKKLNDRNSTIHSKIVIVLENITDPGNAGTIIRNCDWFGVKEIIIGENCVDLYNPKVIRATMGSVFHLKVFESQNLISTLRELKEKGYSIICTDIEGINVFHHHFENKIVIIFSSEASGPANEILDLSDTKITIPKIGKAESLNVASSSAVILAEITKRKIE